MIERVGELEEKWKITLENQLSFGFSSLTVIKGILYAPLRGGQIYTIDTTSGSIKWYFQPPTPSTSVSILPASNDNVYLLGLDNLYVLDGINGTLRWSIPFSCHARFLPTVTNESVYLTLFSKGSVDSYTNSAYALSI
jgi:hypothetical protein